MAGHVLSPALDDESACASYLLGCKSKSAFAVIDPHVDLVAEYLALGGLGATGDREVRARVE